MAQAPKATEKNPYYDEGRYAQHDATIQKVVETFNKDKAAFVGATQEQAQQIPDLTSELVKSWLIQESGGGDKVSKAAWATDPAQVNVPKDWDSHKESLGIKSPQKRNEGTAEQNITAAVGWMAQKGFGQSGQPPANRPKGTFDGWETAIQRYNGRSELATNGKSYSQNYAERIGKRVEGMASRKFTPIELSPPAASHSTHPAPTTPAQATPQAPVKVPGPG